MIRSGLSSLLLAIALVAGIALPTSSKAQQGALNGEWRSFGGDPGNTKYSSLDQINRDNFQDLKVAFTWESISTKVTKEISRIQAGEFKAIPLMVDGLLYVSTALSQVAAIDAGTGETVWEYDPKSYKRLFRPANLGWQHRGVAYWDDGADGRIIMATHDLRLMALNAKTGALYPDFGENAPDALAEALSPAHALPAHTAPLGIAFYGGLSGQGDRLRAFPARYHAAAFVALHGSWNRSVKQGYEVVAVWLDEDGSSRAEPFVRGFERDDAVTGRPVGVAVDPSGDLYVSDDYAGAVYRVRYEPAHSGREPS